MMIFTQDGDLVNSIWIRSITPMTGEFEGTTVYSLTAQFGFLGQSEKDPDLDASTVDLGVYSSEESRPTRACELKLYFFYSFFSSSISIRFSVGLDTPS